MNNFVFFVFVGLPLPGGTIPPNKSQGCSSYHLGFKIWVLLSFRAPYLANQLVRITLRIARDYLCENRRLVSPVGKVPVYRAGGLGSIPGRTNTQGLKIIKEKVLPLL